MTLIKIYELLSGQLKKKLIFIFLSLLAITILETLNIGILIPFLNYVALGENTFLSEYLNLHSDKFVVNFLIIFFVIFLLKSLFLALFQWINLKFQAQIKIFLGNYFLKQYLNLKYIDFIKINSSKLIRVIINETSNVSGILNNYINLILELMVASGIIILLLFYDFKTTIIIFSILLFFAIFYFLVVKTRLKNFGGIELKNSMSALKGLQECFNSFKNVKLQSNQILFTNKYLKHNTLAINSLRNLSFIQSLTRIFLEVLILLIIVFSIIILLNSNFETSFIISKSLIFMAAALRILPSINRILNYLQKLKYSDKTVDLIKEEQTKFLANKKSNKIEDKKFFVSSDDLIIENINFFYGEKQIIKNLNFKIEKKQIIGLRGISGSGKSTLADLICGLLDPLNGKIKLGNISIHDDVNSYQKMIGYVSQSVYLMDDTILNNIAFTELNINIDHDYVAECLDLVGLKKNLGQNNLSENTIVGENGVSISGGQKQRIGIARALYLKPKILILDESFTSIEEDLALEILEKIRNISSLDKIVLISHSSKILKSCDKIIDLQ
jgi:ATP-binding cassette, subfamily B, bacterial PglK